MVFPQLCYIIVKLLKFILRMSEKYGMKLVFKKTFADYFTENIVDRDHKALIARMSALEVLLKYSRKDRFTLELGWSGGAKVLCILHHWGVQLILAYSWARPAILVVGKGRGGMFLFLLFLHFHSCSSFFPVPLFHLLYCLFYLFSPFLWETTQNDPQGLTCR